MTWRVIVRGKVGAEVDFGNTVLDLGACWLGVHPREDRVRKLTEILSLPASVIPIAGIAIGRPGEEKEPRTRFNRDYVHWEKW